MAKTRAAGWSTLARLYGVQTAYVDVEGRRRAAAPEALCATLRALGAPVEGPGDVADAARARRAELAARLCEPVVVAWDGAGTLDLRLPSRGAAGRARVDVRLEDGGSSGAALDLTRARSLGSPAVDGARTVVKRCPLPGPLPFGVHRLRVEAAGRSGEAYVVSAPRDVRIPAGLLRAWGVFLPLYALRTERNLGVGDFGDLAALRDWVAGLGGGVVGTLPLLAAFLDEPFDPSPYAPVSRLFWNELYLDVARLPELSRAPEAKTLLESAGMRAEIEALRGAPELDYRRAMALKRRLLEPMARAFFSGDGARRDAFERHARARPELEAYARFRATVEARRAAWPAWPARLRDGRLEAGDFSSDARDYHRYVQWAAEEQIAGVARAARAAPTAPAAPAAPAAIGSALCLDLPLGVHPQGFDVWREREIFAHGAAAGAPPDTFFTGGQDWGFPPLHPERIRATGYAYVRACLRHNLRHAATLRVDHVMGWHRLFWIPQGFDAAHGVYVRYRPEEFYAVAALESQRADALVAGEDLGTVPRAVREAMARHRVHRAYVAQYSLAPDARRPLGTIPEDAVASLNTHDMPPFAAFWRGLDIAERRRLGWLDERGARAERRARESLKRALLAFLRRGGFARASERDDAAALAAACHAALGASRARLVLVNLEDLWGETEPQNVPGTGPERPNWRRAARHPLETFSKMDDILAALRWLDDLRKQREDPK